MTSLEVSCSFTFLPTGTTIGLSDVAQVVFVQLKPRAHHRRGVAGVVDIAEEADAVVQVLVAPFPLVAGDLDPEIGRLRVLHFHQHAGGGNGQADQDQDRNHGPDDFGLGAVAELRRLGALRLAELDQRIAERSEHDDAHDDANDQGEVVQARAPCFRVPWRWRGSPGPNPLPPAWRWPARPRRFPVTASGRVPCCDTSNSCSLLLATFAR